MVDYSKNIFCAGGFVKVFLQPDHAGRSVDSAPDLLLQVLFPVLQEKQLIVTVVSIVSALGNIFQAVVAFRQFGKENHDLLPVPECL